MAPEEKLSAKVSTAASEVASDIGSFIRSQRETAQVSVRQLAERTAKFTKEIAGKIETVQQGAARAVQSMQQGEAVVIEGVAQFGNVSTALQAVTERIDHDAAIKFPERRDCAVLALVESLRSAMLSFWPVLCLKRHVIGVNVLFKAQWS